MSLVVRPARLIVVALFLGLVAAACSGGSPQAERSEGSDTSVTSSSTSTQAPATQPQPLPVTLDEPVDEAGTLRLGFGGTVALEPVSASPAAPGDMIVSDLLYDTLTVLDENGRVQPGLAEFSSGEDLSVWRFEILDGATFADGSPVTATDVRQSLERVMERGGSSLAAIRLGDIDSIVTNGRSTVQITLSTPSALLPEILSSPLYGVTDATTVAANGGGAVRPNPSGNYAVDAQSERQLVLTRRQGDGPETILVEVFATGDAAFDAFMAGEVDWATVPEERFEDAIAAAGSDGLVPFSGGLYLAIDPGRPPLDNRTLRRAIALSVDRTALVDEIYGAAAQPLLGLIPAGVAGGAVDECRGPCGPDRGAARDAFERVFPDGQDRPLRLLVDDSESMRAVGSAIGEQIEASGFDVEVSSEDAVTYEQLIAAGQQQLFVFGWLGVARTPAEYLVPMFASDSPDNVTGYRNDEIDAQLAAARTNPSPLVREQAWADIEKRVLGDAVVVPLIQFRTATVVAPRVSGLGMRVDGTLDLAEVTIADR